jgi:N-acylneuraminate cytidylyltransferase
MKIIALIPARSGSQRLPHKNIKELAGHPLLAYSVRSALDSGIFSKVIVSSDSQEYIDIAMKYGGGFVKRPTDLDESTDYAWVRHALDTAKDQNFSYDCFAILRPTNPFRTKETIRRAWGEFRFIADRRDDCFSLRGVEPCKQHPAKMWMIDKNYELRDCKDILYPFYEGDLSCNKGYQSLPEVYVQNGSMDMGFTVALHSKQITANRVYPFYADNYTGFDINTLEDWILAEELVKRGMAQLPEVKHGR